MSSFPFENLVVELQLLVASTADPATRLALALCSRSSYAKFRPLDPTINPYEFFDVCARAGYDELLRYAFARGGRLDLFALEEANKTRRESTAFFILHLLKSRGLTPDENYYLHTEILREAARAGFGELIFAVDKRPTDPELSFCAAEGGHLDLALKLREMRRRFHPQNYSLAPFAAIGGHLDIVIELLEDERQMPSTLVEVLEAAVVHGHDEIARYCIVEQRTPLSLVSLRKKKKKHSVDMFDLLREHFPSYFEPLIVFPILFDGLAFTPNVAILQWISGLGYKFPAYLVTQFLIGSTKAAKMGKLPKPVSLEESQTRFECLSYLYDEGYRWDSVYFQYLPRWATLDMIKWITSRSNDGSAYIGKFALHQYLRSHFTADMNVVTYLLEDNVYVSFDVLVESCFMSNNLELLAFISSRVDLKARFYLNEVAYKASKVFEEMHSNPFGLSDQLLKPKLRIRYHNFSQVLAFLKSVGTDFDFATVSLLCSISNPHFQKEIDAIFLRKSRIIRSLKDITRLAFRIVFVLIFLFFAFLMFLPPLRFA